MSGRACLLFALLTATSGCKDPAEGLSDATAIGTPSPAFAGETPKGAFVEKGIEIGRYGGRMVVAEAGTPTSLNPLSPNSTELIRVVVYGRCWDFDHPTQTERPGLCESFERSPDGLTYTFTLREGLRWSDGKPLTAEDYVFTYKSVINTPESNPTKDLFREGIDDKGKDRFPTVEKLDDRRFRFKLHRQDVLFHFNVGSLSAVPKHIWEPVFASGSLQGAMPLNTPPEKMPSSGPYIIKSVDASERIVLERNPHYWKVDEQGNRLPYLDQLTLLYVSDFNVVFLKFMDGETDAIEIRPEYLESFRRREEKDKFKIYDLGPSFTTTYLMFNMDQRLDSTGKPYLDPAKQRWFGSTRFRKAISHAIDRESMTRIVLNGNGQPFWCFFSPANKLWHSDTCVHYTYDLNRARVLLLEDGFKYVGADLVDESGRVVEFTLMTNSENPTRVQMLNMIQEDLKKLGMRVHVLPLIFSEVREATGNRRNFDAVLGGWSPGIPPDPTQNKNVLLSSGASHSWHPSQPTPATPWERQMDELLHRLVETHDYHTRKKLSDELQFIFSDQLPQIQLVVGNHLVAGRTTLGNFNPSPLRPSLYWNVDRIFLKSEPSR